MADSTDDLTNQQLAIQAHIDAMEKAVPGLYMQTALDPMLIQIVLAKSSGKAAFDLWQNFSVRQGVHSAHFPALRRADVSADLYRRLLHPSSIQQGSAGLCGPASLLFDLVGRYPYAYVKYATDLFDTGHADLHVAGRKEIEVRPSAGLRKAPKPARVSSLDWLTMASLRNSENLALFDYAKPQDLFSGMTLPHEMENWLRTAGYTSVNNETDLLLPVNNRVESINKINKEFADGAKIFLFINSNLMYADKFAESSKTADHWVVLTSKIDISNRANIKFSVYSWGQPFYQIPAEGSKKSLELSMLLGNYYGFVSGKH